MKVLQTINWLIWNVLVKWKLSPSSAFSAPVWMTIVTIMLKFIHSELQTRQRKKGFTQYKTEHTYSLFRKRVYEQEVKILDWLRRSQRCCWESTVSASSVKHTYSCCAHKSTENQLTIVYRGKKKDCYFLSFHCGIWEASSNLQVAIFSRRFIWFDSSIGIKVRDSLIHELLNIKGQWFKN